MKRIHRYVGVLGLCVAACGGRNQETPTPAPSADDVRATEFYPLTRARPGEGERMRGVRVQMTAEYRQFVAAANITAEQDAQLRELLVWVQRQPSAAEPADEQLTALVREVDTYRGTALGDSIDGQKREARMVQALQDAQRAQSQRDAALYEEFYRRMGTILTDDEQRLRFALAVDPVMWTLVDPLGP